MVMGDFNVHCKKKVFRYTENGGHSATTSFGVSKH